MITVHHLENSRSQRIIWLLEELKLDYEIKHYARDPQTQLAPDALKRIHPLGKSPVITDGKRTLAESGTIIEYLARRYGNGEWATAFENDQYWDYHYWMQYAEGSLMPPLLLKLIFNKVRTEPPFFVRPITGRIADQVDDAFTNQQIKTHFRYVDQHLASNPWFLGDEISAVDIQMSFPLEAAVIANIIGEEYPYVHGFVSKFQARPAYLRALEAGGDYDYGPKG